MDKATIIITTQAGTPGFPQTSHHVQVRKPNGGLIEGTWGFTDLKVAEQWGRNKAKVAGFTDPVVEHNNNVPATGGK
jgi:hypothetical protein